LDGSILTSVHLKQYRKNKRVALSEIFDDISAIYANLQQYPYLFLYRTRRLRFQRIFKNPNPRDRVFSSWFIYNRVANYLFTRGITSDESNLLDLPNLDDNVTLSKPNVNLPISLFNEPPFEFEGVPHFYYLFSRSKRILKFKIMVFT